MFNNWFGRDIVTETVEANARIARASIEHDRAIISSIKKKQRDKEADLSSAKVERAKLNNAKGALKNAEDLATEFGMQIDCLVETIKHLQKQWAPREKEKFIQEAKKTRDELFRKARNDQLTVDLASEEVEKIVYTRLYKSAHIPRSESSYDRGASVRSRR